jgi:hypothetical protein
MDVESDIKMKINEIITESSGEMPHEHETVLGHVHTQPDQNMYHGSGYLHSRFFKALAGAGAGDTPSINMGEENWAGGDPVIKPYHPIEEEMVDNAAHHVGDHSKRSFGKDHRSTEPDSVNTASPVQARGPITLKK